MVRNRRQSDPIEESSGNESDKPITTANSAKKKSFAAFEQEFAKMLEDSESLQTRLSNHPVQLNGSQPQMQRLLEIQKQHQKAQETLTACTELVQASKADQDSVVEKIKLAQKEGDEIIDRLNEIGSTLPPELTEELLQITIFACGSLDVIRDLGPEQLQKLRMMENNQMIVNFKNAIMETRSSVPVDGTQTREEERQSYTSLLNQFTQLQDGLQAQVQILQQEKDELRVNVKELEEACGEKQREATRLRTHRNQLQQKTDMTDQVQATAMARITSLTTEVDQLRENIANMENATKTLAAQKDQFMDQLKRSHEEVRELHRQHEDDKAKSMYEADQAEQRFSELGKTTSDRLSHLKSEVEEALATREQLRKTLDIKSNSLEEAISDKENIAADLEKHKLKASTELGTMRKQLSDELSHLRSELDAAVANCRETEGECNQLRKMLDNKSNSLTDAIAHNENIAAELQQLKLTASMELGTVREQLATVESVRDALQKQLGILQQDKSRYTLENNQLLSECEDLKVQHLKNLDDHTSMLTDMEANHNKAMDVTESVHAYEITGLQMEMSECLGLQDYLNDQLCQTRKQLATVQQEYAQSIRQVERLQLGYETLGKDAQALIQSEQSRQRQLANEKSLTQNELDRVRRQLEETEAAYSRQTQAQNNLLEAGRTEIARLREQADEQYQSLEQAREENDTLQSNITQLYQEANDKLEGMKRDHDRIIQQMTEELKNYLDEQLEIARLQLEEADVQQRDMEAFHASDIRDFTRQLEEAQSKLDEAQIAHEKANQTFDDQLKKAQSDLKQSDAGLRETKQNLERQKDAHRSLEKQLDQTRSKLKEAEETDQELKRQVLVLERTDRSHQETQNELQRQLQEAEAHRSRDLMKHAQAQDDSSRQNKKISQQLQKCQEDLRRYEKENFAQKLEEAHNTQATQEHKIIMLTQQLKDRSTELAHAKDQHSSQRKELQATKQQAEEENVTAQGMMKSLQREISLQDQHIVDIFKDIFGVDVKADLLKRVLNMFDAPCEDVELYSVTSALWIVLTPMSSTYQAPMTASGSEYDMVFQLLGMTPLDATGPNWLTTVLSMLQSLSINIETSQLKQLGPIMRLLVELLFKKDIGDEKGNFLLKLMGRETMWKVQERFGNAFLDGRNPFDGFSERLKNSELWFLEDAIMDGLCRRCEAVPTHLQVSCGTCFHSFAVTPGHEIGFLYMENSRDFLLLDLKHHSVLLVSKRLAKTDPATWPREDLLIMDPHKEGQVQRRLRNPPSTAVYWWKLNLIYS